MRLAELHNSVGVLESFDSGHLVVCTVRKDRDGTYPVAGQYVSVWRVFPDPDQDAEKLFVGLGLIDSVADGGKSTNCTVSMLNEADSFYPFFPGARLPGSKTFHPFDQEPKRCQGYQRSESYGRAPIGGVYYSARCDKPITRVTEHYSSMACDACYPAAQKQDNESLEAEKEMIENHNNPSRMFQD